MFEQDSSRTENRLSVLSRTFGKGFPSKMGARKDSRTSEVDHDQHVKRLGTVVLVFLMVGFGVLACRVVQINTTMARRLRGLAAAQQESVSLLPARRGMILDARGRVLAGSEPQASVFADPSLIKHPQKVASVLAPVLDLDANEIAEKIATSRTPRFCWLKRRIDDAEADAVRRLNIIGIGLHDEFRRRWPMKQTAAHVLGFVGSDERGLAGLELLYDAHLNGANGRRCAVRDVRRRAIGRGRLPGVVPRDGGHLLLTIDSVIQETAERELAEQIAEFEAESGVALVMSPKTGDLLAMACVPTFDPNHYRHYDPDAWRNRAVTDPVESGSTFKPFVMAGALSGGFLKTTELIDCHNGVHYFGRRRIRDTSPHGLLSPKDIVVYSSNIGMGLTGTRMGNPALHDIITRFGFGSCTQVGFPGESAGIVLPVRLWNSYSTTSVPIGQELAVTPVQLITAFCAIANGGVLLRPRLVKAELAADGSVLESFERPEVIRRVIPEEVARYLAEDVLVAVVERGGRALDIGEYRMFGKTGTAQVPAKDRRGYEPNAYLSSFVGGSPADDPELAVLVMVRKPNPNIGHYGRVVAGPAVRDIMDSALRYLEVPLGLGLAHAAGS